jgi:hypothetical protein
VSSVFGRTGAITAAGGDYTVSQIIGAAPLASPVFRGNVNIIPTTSANLVTLQGYDPTPTATTTTGYLREQFDGNNTFNYYAKTTRGANGSFYNWSFGGAFGGTESDMLTLTNTGNVGIGTTAPGQKLEVSGSIKLSSGSGGAITFQDGTTQTTAYTGTTCGADYAESVGVSGDRTKYEPGDLLVIDPDNPGKFLKANQAYSTMVAGIYSTKPGFVGRKQPASDPDSASEIPMAMVGRVPTKVSAENGPIKVGDLLVTSSTMGYAMKGTDRSQMLGAVIGKALGSLDSGTGVIEVLVTLQ